jgi:glycosyltransferase involved in cell wall biosynthesis
MRASFEKFFPRADPARNFVIPNGFEAAAAEAPAPPTTGPIDIVHAGEIFTGRSLVPVLEAAARLAVRHPQRPVRVITYGELPHAELERIRAGGLERFVEVRPRIPFTALFGELQRAHLLLAVVGDHMLYSTPYKVYDYMAAGRPILGIAPKDAALFELLTDSGAGVCVEREDAAGIERALEQFMVGEVTPLRARVDRFRWANLALQYRTVIETVAGVPAVAKVPAHPPRSAFDA